MARHLGRTTAKNEQLVISYMLMPNSSTHALVTKVDSLPMHVQRSVISLLESPEAQRTQDLAEVLGRRTFADSGKSLFQVLHEMGFLMKMSIDDINMTPTGNTSIPLRQVLTAMGRITSPEMTKQQANGFNPHTHNQQATSSGEVMGIAQNLLIEAQMMEADAAMKRERAYSMVPSLNPQAQKQTIEATSDDLAQLALSAPDANETGDATN